jgi:hypothetical protein
VLAHHVEVEVHVGPGDAGDAVEPEARDRADVLLSYGDEVVVVGHVHVVRAQEEARERLNLAKPLVLTAASPPSLTQPAPLPSHTDV